MHLLLLPRLMMFRLRWLLRMHLLLHRLWLLLPFLPFLSRSWLLLLPSPPRLLLRLLALDLHLLPNV
jgi:hypothetical protein